MLALALLLLAATARADVDPAKYRELPGGAQRLVSSMTVRADDTAIDAAVRRRYAGQHPSGDYDLYINAEGTVDGVHVVRSLDGCDEFIAKHLVTARTTPKPPAPFVRHVTVELRFASAAAPPVAPAALRAKNVPPAMFEQQLLAAPAPHLPDVVKKRARGELVGMYKICAATDGKIIEVAPLQSIAGADEAIMATLRTWQLKPQPMPICSISRFVFSVDHSGDRAAGRAR
jgi:hypothetical protein